MAESLKEYKARLQSSRKRMTGINEHNALNSDRLQSAFGMLCEAVKESLARKHSGRVSLRLHLTDGIIRKPEIERTEFPKF